MGFLGALCCCFPSSIPPSPPEMAQSAPSQPRSDQYPSYIPNGGITHNDSPSASAGGNDEGYSPTMPLPRYTPHPMSIREKTLEAHMRLPPVSPSSPSPPSSRTGSRPTSGEYMPYPDEKAHYDPTASVGYGRATATADDGSSAFSFQSSYGNTSTATRETPPPPYSSSWSPAESPRRSISLSVSSGAGSEQQQQQMVHIAQPRAVFQRPEWLNRSPRGSIDEQVEKARRVSGESR